jgi:hypothetical protein
LHARLDGEHARGERESLQNDAQLARELGFEAEFLERVPYANKPGVCFASQAKFHPDSVEDLEFGEGKIVRVDGQKTVAYRDDTGKVHLLSPVCTHLKCIVRWNAADKTWTVPVTARVSKQLARSFPAQRKRPWRKCVAGSFESCGLDRIEVNGKGKAAKDDQVEAGSPARLRRSSSSLTILRSSRSSLAGMRASESLPGLILHLFSHSQR